jgi:hypothetical protein
MAGGEVEGAWWDRYEAGMVGRAFSFDGDAPGFLVRDGLELRLQDFTLEGWVRRKRISNQRGQDSIFDNYQTKCQK